MQRATDAEAAQTVATRSRQRATHQAADSQAAQTRRTRRRATHGTAQAAQTRQTRRRATHGTAQAAEGDSSSEGEVEGGDSSWGKKRRKTRCCEEEAVLWG